MPGPQRTPHLQQQKHPHQHFALPPPPKAEHASILSPYRPPANPAEVPQAARDWAYRKKLQANRISTYDGKTDLEGLHQWFQKVEHYGKVAALSETAFMEEAWGGIRTGYPQLV